MSGDDWRPEEFARSRGATISMSEDGSGLEDPRVIGRWGKSPAPGGNLGDIRRRKLDTEVCPLWCHRSLHPHPRVAPSLLFLLRRPQLHPPPLSPLHPPSALALHQCRHASVRVLRPRTHPCESNASTIFAHTALILAEAFGQSWLSISFLHMTLYLSTLLTSCFLSRAPPTTCSCIIVL